jgi:hypothetical protein
MLNKLYLYLFLVLSDYFVWYSYIAGGAYVVFNYYFIIFVCRIGGGFTLTGLTGYYTTKS